VARHDHRARAGCRSEAWERDSTQQNTHKI